MTAGFFVLAPAAKKEAGGDAPPVLLSTKGNAPKWTTLPQLQQFAAKGDPTACFELGMRYLEGDEVGQDTSRAIALFEQAAKGGVVNALFRLGKIYHDGLGGSVDYTRALDYFTLAAQAGVTEAQHNIGAMLVSARGVKRDYVEGLAWLMVATKSGDPSDAEAQVRGRLAKRPADIQAATLRAEELLRDLRHASVRAVLTGLAAKPPVGVAPKPPILAPAVAPVEKPAIAVPKIELPDMLKIVPPPRPSVPAATDK